MTVFWALFIAIVLARLAELAYARRNTRRLMAEGAQEFGAGHYPLIVLLHVAWLASLAAFVPGDEVVVVPLLVLFGVVQLLRIWVLVSLGRYWTTRIITLPDVPLVAKGPYRFIRHPNYLVVVLEILILPLCFGAWQIAAVFTLLNGMMLFWRIRAENAVLETRRNLDVEIEVRGT